MRRIHMGVLLAAVAALVVASIAVADENKPSASVAVSAHFTAAGSVKTKACAAQAAGGQNAGSATVPSSKLDTHGQLVGTSTSSDKRLNGPARIDLRLLVNRSGIGIATGTFRVAGRVEADLMAVVSGSNRLDGFLRGTSRGDKRLFANFSATLTGATTAAAGGSATGSTTASTLTGDIGAGSHVNTAVVGPAGC
jgi:hypothetical protein